MTLADVVFWSGAILAAWAGIAALVIAVFALLRWLAVIAAAIIVVGFAFEPETQVRFTATLLGLLAIIYLPLLAGAWAWKQAIRLRAPLPVPVVRASTLQSAHHGFADEEARTKADRQAKTVKDAREQEERIARARDLERQGAFSLWSRP